jgi:putative ABC transport system ATP-binding protein
MIKLKGATKKFGDKVIFDNFNLSINEGEFLCITGKSGSGKTTLLNILGLLDTLDLGSIEVLGKKNPRYKEKQKLRKENFGFVFQNYFLMMNETVRENLLISRFNKKINGAELISSVNKMGLKDDILSQKVYELSGGEQQRVAFSRVLLKQFNILFIDEPTGNLDVENKKAIISTMVDLNRMGKTIICVSHDQEIVQVAERVVNIGEYMVD